MATDLEIGWAAGFYEGEGSICCARKHSLQLSIAQVDEEPLHRFKSIWGGAGTIYLGRGRTISFYQVSGLPAQRIAMTMFPNLSRRRQQQVLSSVKDYAFRTVNDPLHCRRGHEYADVGRYRTECVECRKERRHGVLSPVLPRPTAIECRIGVREFTDETVDTYAPTIQS